MGTLKNFWAGNISALMRKNSSEPNHSELMEMSIVQSFSILFGLPFVPEAVISMMGLECSYQKIPEPDVAESFTKLQAKITGSTEPGKFWFMRKLATDMIKPTKLTIPSVKELKLALMCVKRFASTTVV